jgi:hypothetical protein
MPTVNIIRRPYPLPATSATFIFIRNTRRDGFNRYMSMQSRSVSHGLPQQLP